ncbi:MAG: Gfo/Idh/MocA family protein [Kiloniellales bacterium]
MPTTSESTILRVIVAGLGVQGRKRQRIAGADVVATVDPVVAEADYRQIEDVPLDGFDAALICVPDHVKLEALTYLLSNGKHALVEKPLIAPEETSLMALDELARRQGAVCYTAYNHRFEPHFTRLRDAVASGVLGTIYRARFFYGNGTARDVAQSRWRDHGAGVLPDLGSHLLDTLLFVFADPPSDFRLWAARRFETAAPDHVICAADGPPLIELEMSLVSWRNHFAADVYGERGSAHIDSLCKWGPSTFTLRRRVLPSGRPREESVVLSQSDPTWELEYAHFKRLCAEGGPGNVDNDLWINRVLGALSGEATAEATR